jgi:hypothetical protein
LNPQTLDPMESMITTRPTRAIAFLLTQTAPNEGLLSEWLTGKDVTGSHMQLNVRYYTGIHLGGLQKIMKILSEDS